MSNYEHALTNNNTHQRRTSNETFGMYVPIVHGGQIITSRDGVIIRGGRTIIGTTDEGNAHAIAKDSGIRNTKTIGRLPLSQEQESLLNGIAYVLRPNLGAEINFDKLELHSASRLAERHTKIVEARLSPESFETSARQLALLMALGARGIRLM